jgi:2-iminobutanoate/2-iminopropanoate deaminase
MPPAAPVMTTGAPSNSNILLAFLIAYGHIRGNQFKEVIMSKEFFGASHVPLSPAVRAGDFVFISGQVPVGDNKKIVDGGVAAETRKVLENVQKCLQMAGCDMSDVIKTTIWLRDRDDFAAFNEAYAEFFPKNPPARSTAESRLMIDIAVEIEAIAYKPT